MNTLKAILLGGLSVELSYEVDGDSILWGDGADDHVGVVETRLAYPYRQMRFSIELESLNAVEMDRLRILAFDDYNNKPGTT